MRIVFLGQGAIAQACFSAWFGGAEPLGGHSLAAAVCPATWRAEFEVLGTVPWLDCGVRPDEMLAQLVASTGGEALVSIQYPWVLPAPLLAAVDRRAFNLHNARLPDYRGHNALSHEIINGESRHTVTLHWMDEVVDRGWLCLLRDVPIRTDDTAISLWRRALPEAIDLFSEFLQRLASPKPLPRHPILGVGCYYGRRSLDPFRCVPADASAEYIDRIARALYFPPHEPAFMEHDGRRTYLLPAAGLDLPSARLR